MRVQVSLSGPEALARLGFEESLEKRVDLVSLQAFSQNARLPGTSKILENVEREELYVA